MKYPEDGKFTMRSLNTASDHNLPEFQGIIEKVELLGHGPVSWQADEKGLHVAAAPLEDDRPVVLKVTLK